MVTTRKNTGQGKKQQRRYVTGEIVPYYEVCPDIRPEMRRIAVRNHPRLPDDVYNLVDAYCGDPRCDCRVIYIFVIGDSRPGRTLANITFGWELLEFYRKWMGIEKADDTVRALKGPALMPMAPQTDLAPVLLELVSPRLQETEYVELLKRHYHQFKATLRKNT